MSNGRVITVLEAPFMQMVLGAILGDLGFELVGKATNGTTGINLFEETSPDLVFMDLILPDMEAADAIHAITEKHPKAYIVVCTSLGKQKEILDSLKCGAKDFTLKPFTPQSIKEITSKALTSHR